jgi:hypothetical protein
VEGRSNLRLAGLKGQLISCVLETGIVPFLDKQRYRMVRAVDTPDGMFNLPWVVTPVSVLLCRFLRQH